MNKLKKVIYIALIVIITLIINQSIVKAATVKVTTDTLNLRKEASKNSDILTLISIDEQCEVLEDEGDWYKVKYKSYTGYVTKEYVKLIDENASEGTIDADTTNEEITSEENEDTNTNINNVEEENTNIENIKVSKKTEVKILPLINSSAIDNLKKNTNITVITELSGWLYIQTDDISGWIRSENIAKENSNTDDSNKKEENSNKENEENKDEESNKKEDSKIEEVKQEETTSYEPKTMYVNDTYVNLRKEPSTDSKVVMVVGQNTPLNVIGGQGEWYKLKTSSGEAYVSKKLLSAEKVATTSRSSEIRESDNNTEKTTSTEKVTKTDSSKETKTTTTSNSNKGTQIVEYAKKFLGVPYNYGGASPSGFDCSGFTMYVYKKFGISMRHGAQAQAKLGTEIKTNKNSASDIKEKLRPGDLVFFLDYETMDEIGHCGIYIGKGNFIHASSGSGYCVKINSLLPGEYYNTRYCEARRII